MKSMIAIVVVTFFILAIGCKDISTTKKEVNKENKGNPNKSFVETEDEEDEDAPPSEDPQDYFPMEVGTTWTYEITVGDKEPLCYREIIWGKVVECSRKRFRTLVDNPEKKVFALKIRVKGLAEKQGDLQYPIGVELEVIEDELGIFEDAKKIFWAANTNGRFMVVNVITYDAWESPSQNSWGMYNTEDGSSMNLVFFGSKPGIQISMSDGRDSLLLENVIKIASTEKPLLEFVRTVKKCEVSPTAAGDMLNQGFEERMLFAYGKGLVFMKQKINGKISMSWMLTDFKRGT